MADNEIYDHILYIKEQVLRFAPPKNHASNNDNYGKGDANNYGHVKVDNTVTTSSNPPKGSAVITYVENKISNATSTLKNELQEKINIITSINEDTTEKTSECYNIPTAKAIWDNLQPRLNIVTEINSNSTDSTEGKYNIPTAKTIWNALSSYKDLLVGVDLSMPKPYQGNIDDLIEPGYYKMNHNVESPKVFIYGGKNIYYTNALVTVKKDSNRIIQHVCATEKVTTPNSTEFTYKINGTEFTRYITNDGNTPVFGDWHAAHIPYTKTGRAQNLINVNSITVHENTSGFIIHWKQTNDKQNSYSVTTPLYEYTDICTFNPPLPITGPYIFSNLIGRMDIKITANKMQIRSNIAPGGRIVEVDETYFVPRDK